MSYTIYTNAAPYYGNITLASSGTAYNTGIFSVQASGSWNNTTQGAIQIKGDAEFEGRVRINGADLAETLETIQKRLAILVPDPKLLKKYAALQQAYDHYKTLEALCVDDNNSTQ